MYPLADAFFVQWRRSGRPRRARYAGSLVGVIFATCGSSHFRFDRMMKALATLPIADLHIQHGPAEPPACARAYRYLSFESIVERIEAADVVVSHAGVGSILCAIRAGHTPVIFPRLRRYSETVDDHQAELAEALAIRGNVLIARTTAEFGRCGCVGAATAGHDGGPAPRPLVEAVRETISGAPSEMVGSPN